MESQPSVNREDARQNGLDSGDESSTIPWSKTITNHNFLERGTGSHKRSYFSVVPNSVTQVWIWSAWTSRKVPEQSGRNQLKAAIAGLRDSEEEKAAPQAIKYADQLVDRLPSACFDLPAPDISATSKEEVYFEWMLEKDGRLLLTVGPDGTVAYVCTFGTARSKNLGSWNDRIGDLMAPCFDRLVDIHRKDLPAWNASKTARP